MQRYLVVLFGILALATPVYAERACCTGKSNWYVGASGLGVYQGQVEYGKSAALAAVHDTTGYDLDPGIGISALIGYNFFPNASIELEFLGQDSGFAGFDNGVATLVEGGGDTQRNTAVMVNHRWIDRSYQYIAPYLAVGGGMMHIDTPVGIGGTTLKDKVLAYQFMAGLNFTVPDSKFEFFTGYRYIGTAKGENIVTGGPGRTVEYDADSHNLELGGRLRF
jgi:hypothetical protein